MKKSIVLIVAAAVLLMGNICLGAPASTGGGLIPPPAINIPYGASISFDINISDSDILGIIKQTIPAVATTSDEILAQAKQRNAEAPGPIALLSSIQLQKLGEVIDGIKGVRVVVAKYNKKISLSDVTKDFEKGLVKTGTFSKVAGGLNILPGVIGFYAEAGNSGYMAFSYDPQERKIYAVRIVGSIDIPKLAEWAMRAAGAINAQDDESEGAPSAPAPAVSNDAAPASNQ